MIAQVLIWFFLSLSSILIVTYIIVLAYFMITSITNPSEETPYHGRRKHPSHFGECGIALSDCQSYQRMRVSINTGLSSLQGHNRLLYLYLVRRASQEIQEPCQKCALKMIDSYIETTYSMQKSIYPPPTDINVSYKGHWTQSASRVHL